MGIMICTSYRMELTIVPNPFRMYISFEDIDDHIVNLIKRSYNKHIGKELNPYISKENRQQNSTLKLEYNKEYTLKLLEDFLKFHSNSFLNGNNDCHMAATFCAFCNRRGHIAIPTGANRNFFSDLLREYCLSSATIGTNHGTFYLYGGEKAKEFIDTFNEFTKTSKYSDLRKLSDLYAYYKEFVTEKKKIPLSRESFKLLSSGMLPRQIGGLDNKSESDCTLSKPKQ